MLLDQLAHQIILFLSRRPAGNIRLGDGAGLLLCDLNRPGVAIVPEVLHRSKVPAEAGLPRHYGVAEIYLMTGRKKIGGFTHVESDGAKMFATVCKPGLEGIVSKQLMRSAIKSIPHLAPNGMN